MKQKLKERCKELEKELAGKNYELQIEAALQKVRSRTISMQKSEELAETSFMLFQEFTDLVKTSKRISVGIFDEQARTMELYSTLHGSQWKQAAPVDMNEPVLMKKIYAAWKKKKKSLVIDLSGNNLRRYHTYRTKLSGLNYKEKRLLIHVAFFSKGVLTFSSAKSQPKETIPLLERFALVFEGTYIRFLDLQKAEAQAREAEIELSLERVRSRSMSMRSSNELAELVATVFCELTKLGFDLTSSIIWIHNSEKSSDALWVASAELNKPARPYYISPFHKGFFTSIIHAWKAKDPHWIFTLEGKEKILFQKYFIKEVPELPKELKKTLSGTDKMFFSASFSNFGALEVVARHPLTDDKFELLHRFGKVFDLSFTRFLDLQKAEAQAREAQIEVALERVRSRSLAMHHPSEIQAVIHRVRDELLRVNISIFGGSFIVINKDVDAEVNAWGSGGPDETTETPGPNFGMPFCTSLIKGIKNGPGFFTEEFSQQQKIDYFTELFKHEPWSKLPAKHKKAVLESEGGYTRSVCVSNHTSILIVNQNGSKFTEEDNDVLKRFAKVFEQSYTRFLDLQKAEEQAREAEIQLALERVRARTMAMQKSDELPEVANILSQQLRNLGGNLWGTGIGLCKEGSGEDEFWFANENGILPPVAIPNTVDPVHIKMYEGWKNKLDQLTIAKEGEELKAHYKYMLSLPSVKPFFQGMLDSGLSFPTSQIWHAAYFTHGYLLLITSTPYEEKQIFTRFAKVFEQTYTRFLDLQKAEAQAREAKIEAALEKVRSRSMGMQKSEELKVVIQIVYEQFSHLNINVEHTGFIMDYKERDDMHIWLADQHEVPSELFIPYFDSSHWNSFNEAKEKGTDFFATHLDFEEKNKFYKDLFELIPMVPKETLDYYFSCPGLAGSTVLLDNVSLYIENFQGIPYTDQENHTLTRFGKVFQQTYTRFLDLQKAEAQAREAQTEAALERVRSRTMAMFKSQELLRVIKVVSQQLQQLGIRFDHVSFGNTNQSQDYHFWTSMANTLDPRELYVPWLDNPIFENIRKAQKQRLTFFTDILTPEENNQWTLHMLKHMGEDFLSEDNKSYILNKAIARSVAILPNIFLIMAKYSPVPYSDFENEILMRFGQVFDQTYTRFLDLQKAEAQAREAQIEAGLERVRSRTLAMQKSDELVDTSMVIFEELINLGIEPNRLFIGIINNKTSAIESWATNEDGNKIDHYFTLKTQHNESVKKMYDGWKQKKSSITIDMQGTELQNYFHYLASERHFSFEGGLWQTRRVQTIAYFGQGLIGLASTDEQPEATTQLLERFAAVFNLTYTRFNDLKIAEAHAIKAEEDLIEIKAARKKAEEALTELQSAQKQLIQSEKMASLGELTAGIAHEIQNPLNFVNNFSEVSNELVDEMNAELDKGDIDEAKEIANDIKQNLEKINHHGKRAGDIVKGMLQHSRTSTGVKEATDINALADEYFRLSYHGLRAKDKTFNAKMETDFDDSIGKIHIIPQDIGRVLLNLYNNAFYAVNEKAKLSASSYQPIASVTTKKSDSYVLITVSDNGNGIAQKIVDKIFQPFFTTKPTGSGTGLGLSLSYDIVKAHGGEIKVETEDGKGSIFIVQLPFKSN